MNLNLYHEILLRNLSLRIWCILGMWHVQWKLSCIDNFSIRIQIKLKSQFEFVLRDTEEFEFMDLVDFGDVALSVEIYI